MIKTDSVRQLYSRINVASQLLKTAKNRDERIALANYIGNTYAATKNIDSDVGFYLKRTLGKKKEYVKFLKRLDIYKDQMLEHFIANKDFHENFFSEIMFPVENNLALIECDIINNNVLSEDDFYTIFYDFMKSLNLQYLVEKLIKERRIHSSANEEQTVLGFTLYNPLNKDIDIFVDNFNYTVSSMFTLAHEFGHAYDLLNFNEDVPNYNRYFYQSFNGEVISKLFERLFVTYMIEKRILIDESKDKLFDLEYINHSYLLGSYIISLLDAEYISNESYAMLCKEEVVRMVKGSFVSASAVDEFISNSTYFDLWEDFTYAYGDIISMFLHEAVKESGFDNEMFNDFNYNRSNLFDKGFFDKWNMTSNRYVDLHNKELQLLKK